MYKRTAVVTEDSAGKHWAVEVKDESNKRIGYGVIPMNCEFEGTVEEAIEASRNEVEVEAQRLIAIYEKDLEKKAAEAEEEAQKQANAQALIAALANEFAQVKAVTPAVAEPVEDAEAAIEAKVDS